MEIDLNYYKYLNNNLHLAFTFSSTFGAKSFHSLWVIYFHICPSNMQIYLNIYHTIVIYFIFTIIYRI